MNNKLYSPPSQRFAKSKRISMLCGKRINVLNKKRFYCMSANQIFLFHTLTAILIILGPQSCVV